MRRSCRRNSASRNGSVDPCAKTRSIKGGRSVVGFLMLCVFSAKLIGELNSSERSVIHHSYSNINELLMNEES